VPIELRNVLICRDDEAIPREGGYRFEHGLVLRDMEDPVPPALF
jgi:hypothetical protein